MNLPRGLRNPKSTPAPIQTRPWKNPALDAALDALSTLSPQQTVASALAHLRPLRPQVENHVQATRAFADRLMPSLEALRERTRSPDLHGDDAADLLALLGGTLIKHSSHVRETHREAMPFKTVARLINESDEALRTALRTRPNHPAAATFRLTNAVESGSTPADLWARFQVARTVCDSLFPAHWAMLDGLAATGHGGYPQMFEFARSIALNASVGNPEAAMLPLAHIEYYNLLLTNKPPTNGPSAGMLVAKKRQADTDAVATASYRWCGDDTSRPPAHACDVQAHNLFGWFLGNTPGHRERGRWHLMQAERRMTAAPWNYLPPNPVAAFQALHTMLRINY